MNILFFDSLGSCRVMSVNYSNLVSVWSLCKNTWMAKKENGLHFDLFARHCDNKNDLFRERSHLSILN